MPSGRKRKRPDDPAPVFFLDRNLGRNFVPQAIRERGFVALPMCEVYQNGEDQFVQDDDWIARADRESWVAITKDKAIIRAHTEALERTRLRVFTFNRADIEGPAMAQLLAENLNRILQRASKPGPYVYVIEKNRLRRIWPKEQVN